ncbi:MAG: GGDEF domain-containing phosphodiesterase [Bacillota bacterium]
MQVPAVADVIPRLAKIARRHRVLGLVFVDLVGFASVQESCGTSTGDSILDALGRVLSHTGLRLGNATGIVPCTTGGDDFLLFFPNPGEKPHLGPHLEQLRELLEVRLNAAVCTLPLDRKLTVHLGYAEIRAGPDSRMERLIYEAMKEAVLMAKSDMGLEDFLSRQEMLAILGQGQIQSVYQPIVSLTNGRTVGYEALSRGPEGSRWHEPLTLFHLAQKYGLLIRLEELCHRQAIAGVRGLFDDLGLFLNVDPGVLGDPAYDLQKLGDLLAEARIEPGQVTLELTERSAASDLARLRRAVEVARAHGLGVALDDVGSGYSSLRTLVELQPDYVKIDGYLVANCHRDPARRVVVETLAHLARRLGCTTVAEGVEQPPELDTLVAVGVDLAQGYLFAYPARKLTAPDAAAVSRLRAGRAGTT